MSASSLTRITRSTANKNTSSISPKMVPSNQCSPSNADLMSAITELRNESLSSNKSVLASLSDLTNNFNSLSSLVSELKMENANLRSELDDLKLKVNNSDATGSVVQTPAIISHILQETFERERCASNAIVYGITESAHLTTSQRILDDRTAIGRILEPLDYVIPMASRVIRLGKFREGSSRPIKIIFNSKDEADSLIDIYSNSKRNGSTFPDGFRIVKDKTILQRQLLRSCHTELELRNKNGEQGLRIVYASGIPKVSSTQSKNGSTRVQSINQS
jgi:hypothetical protein